MQLIVLGMHRSGTSVLARATNLMGAYFGPEGISTGANQENPKGFWERKDVRVLNDSVLHGVGCDWDRVLKFDPAILPPALVADFDKRASRLVLEMDAHRPWLLKEPRLCLLLPLWRKWLEAPVCIHIFRNPVEVASSLRVRNGIPIDAGIALWEHYVRSALAGSAGLPKVVVSHQQLMQEPAAAISQLFHDLIKLGVPGLRMPSEREIHAFVQEGLYRERESREDLQAYAAVPQLALFKTLEAGRMPSAKLLAEVGNTTALAEYEAGLPPLNPPNREAKVPQAIEVALRADLALRDQEIKFVREISSKLEADVRQRDERLNGIERDYQQVREAAALLQGKFDQREGRIVALEHDLTSARQEAARVVGELKAREAQVARLEGQHARDMADLQSRLLAAQGALAKAEHDVTAASTQLERAKQARSSAERTADLRLRDISRLTRMLMKQDSHVVALNNENAGLAGKLKNAQDMQAKVARQKADADNACRVAEAEAAELRRQLDVIRRSITWRMGAPIRVALRLLRRSLGRAPMSDVELLRKSEWFDASWYRSRYPDVAQNGVDPAEHYLSFGGKEGRNPGPRFNTTRYLDINKDVAQSGMNALVHYLKHGKEEGRKQC